MAAAMGVALQVGDPIAHIRRLGGKILTFMISFSHTIRPRSSNRLTVKPADCQIAAEASRRRRGDGRSRCLGGRAGLRRGGDRHGGRDGRGAAGRTG
jgi:hypothetical protein